MLSLPEYPGRLNTNSSDNSLNNDLTITVSNPNNCLFRSENNRTQGDRDALRARRLLHSSGTTCLPLSLLQHCILAARDTHTGQRWVRHRDKFLCRIKQMATDQVWTALLFPIMQQKSVELILNLGPRQWYREGKGISFSQDST